MKKKKKQKKKSSKKQPEQSQAQEDFEEKFRPYKIVEPPKPVEAKKVMKGSKWAAMKARAPDRNHLNLDSAIA